MPENIPEIMKDEEMIPVKVWDWETRILHWINATLIISLMILAMGNEALHDLGVKKALRKEIWAYHVYIGYALIFTFFLRLLWGFFGNRYAGWADINPFTREKLGYIVHKIKWYLGGFRGDLPKYLGHDPLGSLFYIAVFIIIISQIVSGVVLAGVELHLAPWKGLFGGYSHAAREVMEGAAEEVHEFGLYFIIIFLFAHLGAIIVHELKERSGLLSSMVHGSKYLPKDR